MSARRGALRRYPALAFLVAAGLLATLLPSSLRLPLAGPASVAEVAPVPGERSDVAAGDVADLGAASSGGLGFGAGSGGAAGSTATTVAGSAGGGAASGGAGVRRNPRSKRCVGDPPRQTEDPLSPPCVAFFDGDNGGATTRGVSRDEIVIVVYAGIGSGNQQPGYHDWTAPITESDSVINYAGRAFTRHFNERYQTYGRRVRVFGYFSSGQGSPAQWKADVAAIDADKRPFGMVSFFEGVSAVSREAAARQIFAASYPAYARADYREVAPYLMSFNPDLENQAEMTASYVCRKLNGRRARWSSDPRIRDQNRRFGLLYTDSDTDPEYRVLKDLVRAELSRQCSIQLAAEVGVAPAAANYPPAIASLQTANVTTVINVNFGGVSANASHNAAAQGYFPEWFIPGGGAGARGPDRNSSAHTHNQSAWEAAFGMTFDYRRDEQARQSWHQAFREGCPTCPEVNRSDLVELYDALAMLMYGIQAAGPRLTPESFDRGMHAIPQRGSSSPYKPAAYFAPGNYSFVKDAAEMWWDETGQAPGSRRPGCYRLVRDGVRSRAEDWAGDDSELFTGTPPCQGNQTPGPAGS